MKQPLILGEDLHRDSQRKKERERERKRKGEKCIVIHREGRLILRWDTRERNVGGQFAAAANYESRYESAE